MKKYTYAPIANKGKDRCVKLNEGHNIQKNVGETSGVNKHGFSEPIFEPLKPKDGKK